MHNRIIQLETNPKQLLLPSEYDAFPSAEDITWFMHSVADSVSPDPNRTETLRALEDQLGISGNPLCCKPDAAGGCLILRDGWVNSYLMKCYERFSEALDAIRQRGWDGFRVGLTFELIDLEAAYSDRYGTYIINSDLGICPLNNFLRVADRDVPYYYGATADYHF